MLDKNTMKGENKNKYIDIRERKEMSDLNDKLNGFVNTADHTEEFDAADIQSNKVMAVLAYLGILILIPVFAARNSKFVRFHVNQSLALWVVAMVVSVILSILGKVPLIGKAASFVSSGISIVEFILCVLGILNACNGKAKELPIVGGIKLLNNR